MPGSSFFDASVAVSSIVADAPESPASARNRRAQGVLRRGKRSALLLVFLLATFCGAAAAARERLNVVFLNPGKSGETFWGMVSEAMRAAAAQLDVDIEIVYSERNYQTLQRLGLEIVGRPKPPDYLIVVNEEAAATPVVEAANAAGVKTFLLANVFIGAEAQKYGAPRTVLKNWIGSLEPDLKAAGARMAQALIDAAQRGGRLSEDGKIHLLALAGDDRTPNSIARTEGFSSVAASRPDVVVDRLLFANWNAIDAETLTERYLTWAAHAGVRPAGVWAANDPTALGALGAIEKNGLVPGKDVGVVGLNWSPEAFEKIRSGELILTEGGHFLGGAWALVMLRDYADGCDFALRGAAQRFPMASIDQSNVARLSDLISARKFDRIDFRAFLASGRRPCGEYDFSLAALLRAAPATAAR